MGHYIEFRDVSFHYEEGRPVLKNINLAIEKGQFVAIMGGSGCGKTTLLKLLTRQLSPATGEVLVEGRNLDSFGYAELADFRRRMGVLFQLGALFTDLNVLENVAFPIREHTKLDERTIRDLAILKLDAVGLRGTEKFYPEELSGGMARRVALARSMALDPELLLFDEPFTGLDPITLGVIAHLLSNTNKYLGATSVMVTHDIAKSLDIVDRAVFMSGGEIIFEGAPEEMRRLDSPWISQFVKGEAKGPVKYRFENPKSLLEDLMGN